MPTIICKINLGTRLQRIYIQNEKYSKKEILETYWMPFEAISDFILKQEDVFQVKMYGPKSYTEKIEKEVHEKELTKYSKIKTNFIYH